MTELETRHPRVQCQNHEQVDRTPPYLTEYWPRFVKRVTLEFTQAFVEILYPVLVMCNSLLVDFSSWPVEESLMFASSCSELLTLFTESTVLVWVKSIFSFFKILFYPPFIFDPLFIVISIQRSRGKHEYGFPVVDWANNTSRMYFSFSSGRLLISSQKSCRYRISATMASSF